MIGLTMVFSTEILLKSFGSYLAAGSIAALNYALRVMFILVGLFGQAVGVASYPYMAKLAAENNVDELNHLLNGTLKFILLVLPVSTLFMAGAHEIILLLFQRGAFDAAATDVTADILPFFMAGAFAFAAQNLVSRGFYATQNTLFPTVLSTTCVLLSIPVIYLFMRVFGAIGVAAGLSLSVILQCFVLYESWSRKSGNTQKQTVYLFLLKIVPVSLFTGLPLYVSAKLLRTAIAVSSDFIQALVVLSILSVECVALFFIAGIVFKIEEIPAFINRIYKRMALWKKK